MFMDYVFVEPLSMTSMFVLFIAFLVLLVYLTYLFIRRAKISSLKKIPTAFIIGYPNSGKSFILKELCKCKENFDKILNINYFDVMHDGISKSKILDHQGFFSRDGKINHDIIDELKAIEPQYIISIIDVSPFSEPIENQINFVTEVNKKFKGKKIFLVANKIDKSSKNKLNKIKGVFGNNFYEIRSNNLSDIKKLREDLIRFLKV